MRRPSRNALSAIALLAITTLFQGAHASACEDLEDGCGEEDDAPWAQGGQDIYNAVFGKAVIFQHPRNGTVYLYPNNDNWYLMRSNHPRTGEPMGEGGKWSVRGNELCIDTAIKQPSFAGCGEFRVAQGGREAEWDHPFAMGLRISIRNLNEIPR